MDNRLIKFIFGILLILVLTIALLEEQKVDLIPNRSNVTISKVGYYSKSQGMITTNFQPYESVSLPLKARDHSGIALTFDDKNVDEWYSFLMLSYKYGAKATFFVNSFHTLNDDQVHKLRKLQGLNNEIGFHTVNHINVLKYLDKNTMDTYIQTEIIPGINLMRENGFLVKSFAYPFGSGNTETDKELLKFFDHVRYTTYPTKGAKIKEMDVVYVKNPSPKVMKAVGIDNDYFHSIEEIYEGIDRAAQNNEVIVLYAHSISDQLHNLNISFSKLEMIIKYAYDKGLRFYTIEEL